tara:strand:- start:727 stop:1263 length:537 start_codon:yes stop_codon:yes gene_type:complete
MLGIGAKVKHPTHDEGVIFGTDGDFWRIYFREVGEKSISKEFDGLEVIEEAEDMEQPDVSDIMTAMEHVLGDFTDRIRGEERPENVEISDRWDGGNLIIQPADDGLKSKEIPVDTFFHKIVMTRDRLRVLEAKINAHEKLVHSDKIDLQQYITKIYGSLTTFNVLFKYKEDWFVGEKK